MKICYLAPMCAAVYELGADGMTSGWSQCCWWGEVERCRRAADDEPAVNPKQPIMEVAAGLIPVSQPPEVPTGQSWRRRLVALARDSKRVMEHRGPTAGPARHWHMGTSKNFLGHCFNSPVVCSSGGHARST